VIHSHAIGARRANWHKWSRAFGLKTTILLQSLRFGFPHATLRRSKCFANFSKSRTGINLGRTHEIRQDIKVPHKSTRIVRVKLTFSVNRELESIESDQKKGKLPAYETEQEHHNRKLVDNYGPGRGMGSVGAMGVPKIPNFAPSEKPKKPPKYTGGRA
jgi:hypothetical protein